MSDYAFRKKALGTLTTKIGAYVLTDLAEVPVYVGKSVKSIRERVQRHLTSARSDIIANRKLDVWEVAWVWAYVVKNPKKVVALEAALYHHFNAKSPLMNGTVPAKPLASAIIPEPDQKVRLIHPEDVKERLDPKLRLPRQAHHYAGMVDHFLVVKNTAEVAQAMDAQFKRLTRYHETLLRGPMEEESEEPE